MDEAATSANLPLFSNPDPGTAASAHAPRPALDPFRAPGPETGHSQSTAAVTAEHEPSTAA